MDGAPSSTVLTRALAWGGGAEGSLGPVGMREWTGCWWPRVPALPAGEASS